MFCFALLCFCLQKILTHLKFIFCLEVANSKLPGRSVQIAETIHALHQIWKEKHRKITFFLFKVWDVSSISLAYSFLQYKTCLQLERLFVIDSKSLDQQKILSVLCPTFTCRFYFHGNWHRCGKKNSRNFIIFIFSMFTKILTEVYLFTLNEHNLF